MKYWSLSLLFFVARMNAATADNLDASYDCGICIPKDWLVDEDENSFSAFGRS